jgi:hypothetical protein
VNGSINPPCRARARVGWWVSWYLWLSGLELYAFVYCRFLFVVRQPWIRRWPLYFRWRNARTAFTRISLTHRFAFLSSVQSHLCQRLAIWRTPRTIPAEASHLPISISLSPICPIATIPKPHAISTRALANSMPAIITSSPSVPAMLFVQLQAITDSRCQKPAKSRAVRHHNDRPAKLR